MDLALCTEKEWESEERRASRERTPDSAREFIYYFYALFTESSPRHRPPPIRRCFSCPCIFTITTPAADLATPPVTALRFHHRDRPPRIILCQKVAYTTTYFMNRVYSVEQKYLVYTYIWFRLFEYTFSFLRPLIIFYIYIYKYICITETAERLIGLLYFSLEKFPKIRSDNKISDNKIKMKYSRKICENECQKRNSNWPSFVVLEFISDGLIKYFFMQL